MTQNKTIILAGDSELMSLKNVALLESAGYLVIQANNLDYALVACEMFQPKSLILDADRFPEETGLFCRTLISRPNHPPIHILCTDKKLWIDDLPHTGKIECVHKPALLSLIIGRIEAAHKNADFVYDEKSKKNPRKQERNKKQRLKQGLIMLTGTAAIAAVLILALSTQTGMFKTDTQTIEDAHVPLAPYHERSTDAEKFCTEEECEDESCTGDCAEAS